eukprot:g7485.t1
MPRRAKRRRLAAVQAQAQGQEQARAQAQAQAQAHGPADVPHSTTHRALLSTLVAAGSASAPPVRDELLMLRLLKWYKRQARVGSVGAAGSGASGCSSGGASAGAGAGSLVVVFENFECLDPFVSRTVVRILHLYAQRHGLPVQLVFGVAMPDALHRLFPRAMSKLLWIERFVLQSPVQCLDDLIDELLIEGVLPLQLNKSVLEWMVHDHFLLSRCSLQEFVRALHFVIHSHFACEPASFLCTRSFTAAPARRTTVDSGTVHHAAAASSFDEASLPFAVAAYGLLPESQESFGSLPSLQGQRHRYLQQPAVLRYIATLPSVSHYYKTHPQQESVGSVAAGGDDVDAPPVATAHDVVTWLEALAKHRLRWAPVLDCLLVAIELVDPQGKGRKRGKALRREIHTDALQHGVASQHCAQAVSGTGLLRVDLDALLELVDNWQEILREAEAQCSGQFDLNAAAAAAAAAAATTSGGALPSVGVRERGLEGAALFGRELREIADLKTLHAALKAMASPATAAGTGNTPSAGTEVPAAARAETIGVDGAAVSNVGAVGGSKHASRQLAMATCPAQVAAVREAPDTVPDLGLQPAPPQAAAALCEQAPASPPAFNRSSLSAQWRRDVVGFFKRLLAAHLKPLHKMVLHEAVQYYARSPNPRGSGAFKARKDRALQLRRAFVPSHKAAILTALGKPRAYLECACCEAQHDTVLPTMHDACIAYKLYAECGRMINLLDWCDAGQG